MIAIQLAGGLGNQLFQIFATIAYALEHNMPFVIVYSKMLNERKTYWDDFLLPIKEYTNYKGEYTNDFIYKLPYYQEPRFSYDSILKVRNLRIGGYFQSHKYFKVHQDTIFSMIHLREQQELIKIEYANYFHHSVLVSLHFRLGDYKVKQEFHPVMPIEYYIHSLKKIGDTVKQAVSVLYFCEKEDNDYVFTLIQKLQNVFPLYTFIKVDDEIVDWKQLLIMSCCHHQIIANSSFSWFSAYFNNYVGKVVCYPSKWFGPNLKNHSLDDLFPKEWTKIDV